MARLPTRFWGWALVAVLLFDSGAAGLVLLTEKPPAARFEQIAEGMTREQVLAIMGPPLSTSDMPGIAYADWTGAGKRYVVWFENELAVEKKSDSRERR
jgi:SmpA/OmlA family protein